MAPSKGTDRQTFRLPDPEWAEFDRAAREMGKDRSMYLREFIRWATRAPGAKMPGRPTAGHNRGTRGPEVPGINK